MVQLPSAPRLSGNRKPACSAAVCRFCSTQPASTVMVELPGSTARTALMRCRLSTTCVPLLSGVEPTTRPVLPPCGTMLAPAAAQALTTSATCCVLPGRTTASAVPRTRLRQSCSHAPRSAVGSSWVRTLVSPTMRRRESSKVRVDGLMVWWWPRVGRQRQFWRCAGAGARAWHRR